MPPRILLSLFTAALLALAVAAPASASSVAYIDDHNLWFSSPDGARKVQVTQGGSNDASWMFPSQGRDGKTVVVKHGALYLYGPDGKLVTVNVMPKYAGTASAVYPLGLDMDWNSNAVAYGYQYCGFACTSLYKGFWLTFSDNQGAFPSDPQGQSDAFNPTFYKTRVVFRDSGGNIFVQPDVAEAPFTSSYQGWITHGDGYFLSRAEVCPPTTRSRSTGSGTTAPPASPSPSTRAPSRATSSPPATSRRPARRLRHVLPRRLADGVDR